MFYVQFSKIIISLLMASSIVSCQRQDEPEEVSRIKRVMSRYLAALEKENTSDDIWPFLSKESQQWYSDIEKHFHGEKSYSELSSSQKYMILHVKKIMNEESIEITSRDLSLIACEKYDLNALKRLTHIEIRGDDASASMDNSKEIPVLYFVKEVDADWKVSHMEMNLLFDEMIRQELEKTGIGNEDEYLRRMLGYQNGM